MRNEPSRFGRGTGPRPPTPWCLQDSRPPTPEGLRPPAPLGSPGLAATSAPGPPGLAASNARGPAANTTHEILTPSGLEDTRAPPEGETMRRGAAGGLRHQERVATADQGYC